MRSKILHLDRYDTDKVASRYMEIYDPIMEPWVEKDNILLELGVHTGGSLLLWRDYFPHSIVVGIDLQLPQDFIPGERIFTFQGSQADTRFLSQVANHMAPQGFDVIIDDASHIGELTKTSFWHLFEHHLKPGGLYVIEDWGTGYWDDWPDGKSFESYTSWIYRGWLNLLNRFQIPSRLAIKIPMRNHSYGMVGLVKSLVDEQGAVDMYRYGSAKPPGRNSKFERMVIFPSIVFIHKSANVSPKDGATSGVD